MQHCLDCSISHIYTHLTFECRKPEFITCVAPSCRCGSCIHQPQHDLDLGFLRTLYTHSQHICKVWLNIHQLTNKARVYKNHGFVFRVVQTHNHKASYSLIKLWYQPSQGEISPGRQEYHVFFFNIFGGTKCKTDVHISCVPHIFRLGIVTRCD